MRASTPRDDGALQDSRDWLRVTLSSIGDAVVTTDDEGRVTFLNPLAETLTGWKVEEAVGHPLAGLIRIISEESRDLVEIPTVQALRECRTVELASHSLLVARDGTERPISDSAALIRNDDGEVRGVVLVFRDVTKSRQTERALQRALVYADDIIATLREPFLVLDADLRVKTANRSFYDAFKVSKEETENCPVYELGNGQWDIPGLRTLLDEVLSRNHSVDDFEVEHVFPSLGRKSMLLNARPFPPDSKHPELILLAMQDVSAARARAEELAEAAANKDEFLATLAHELRNPLAPIRNAALCLDMENLSASEVRTAKDVIGRQVTVMVRLIDDLLDVSRISRNTLGIRKECIDLGSVVASAVECSSPLIQQFGHTLTVRLPEQPILLEADAIRLAQVFSNLLNNAARYTKPGGLIELGAERDGTDAVIRVRDDGIGIRSDMLTGIFDMFTQADRTAEQAQTGLGVGLTLARRLVEMHGGNIEARSIGLGVGSEFVVRIPMIDQIPIAVPKAASSCRILVVDDNKDSADSLGMLLRRKGNDIRLAYDGREALEVAASFRPELVLLDIGLPKLDGFEVARRIRKLPWGSDVVLVALTGWGQDEDRRRSAEAGFDAHLVKPLLPEFIDDLLAGWLVSSPAANRRRV